MVSEEILKATGLPERVLQTYRLAGEVSLPQAERETLASQLGVKPNTVKTHLARVRVKLADPESLKHRDIGRPHTSQKDPEGYAAAVVGLSDPARNIAKTARDVGLSPKVAAKIAQELDGEMLPLKREIEEISLGDLTLRFGTLTRDSIDAITQEKLEKASARDLAVIAGIGAQNWQLLRGQPTQRMEINDRRELSEIVKMMVSEAKRRGIEIDVTPEGEATAKKSPYRSMRDQKLKKQISSGDPAEVLVQA